MTTIHQAYRNIFWSRPHLHRLYLKARGFDLDFSGKDFVVQGFPRSGVTFLSVLFKEYAARPVELFTHLRTPTVIDLALEEEKVVFLAIRDPLASVISLIQVENWSPDRALDHYLEYYTNALRHIENVHVMDFDYFTKNIPLTLAAVEHVSGVPYNKDVIHENARKEVFAVIDALNIEHSGTIRVKGLHRPHDERQSGKGAISALIRLYHSEKLAKCDTIYKEFSSYCMLQYATVPRPKGVMHRVKEDLLETTSA